VKKPPSSQNAVPDTERPVRPGRRAFLKAGAGVTAAGVAAAAGAGALLPAAATAAPVRPGRARVPAGANKAPLPKVLRSLRELGRADATTTLAAALPITQRGTTYEMAQEARWIDAEHFAVGRWDGTMSIFSFETAPYQGPIVHEAVNAPAFQGVQMITPLPGPALVTSNDYSSLALWQARGGDWSRLVLRGTPTYDPALGTARSGAWVDASGQGRLVVGHSSGFLSVWLYDAATHALTFERSVDVRNSQPTNPWDDHTIEDVVVADGPLGVVAAGSEDGYVTMLQAPTGTILSQTVFNPQAQRGINAVSVSGNRLLVSNCSVGSSDFNTWYFAIDKSTWSITLLDKANLIIDTSRPQVFNFDIVWGTYSGGRCWFASTEEGALWMGTASSTSLTTIGYEQLTAPLGSALAFRNSELVMVAYDLYQFTTNP
jgi:hypothetical protein